MYFINQYIKKTDNTITKAVYDRDDYYAAEAEWCRRHGEGMNASTTVWVLTTLTDELGATYYNKRSDKPVEQAEPTTEA